MPQPSAATGTPFTMPAMPAVGPALLRAAALAALLAALAASAKRPPGRLFRPSRLVMEIPKLEPCAIPGNAIVIYNIENSMISKVDFGLNFDFNITRSVAALSKVAIEITKCRESVSSNNCESYQTWRFTRNPCKALTDPGAVWRLALSIVRPPSGCPLKKGSYSLRNYSLSSVALATVPLPWEGNVWLSRFTMFDPVGAPHLCVDSEMRVHRVRD